jgi:hypothetical protein
VCTCVSLGEGPRTVVGSTSVTVHHPVWIRNQFDTSCKSRVCCRGDFDALWNRTCIWFPRKMFMQIALMMPCYVDFFYPEVGVAALELLDL